MNRKQALLLLGVLLVITACVLAALKQANISKFERVDAAIVSIDSSNPGRRVATLSYSTHTGGRVTSEIVVDKKAVANGRIREGSLIPILIDPANPTIAVRDTFFSIWIVPLAVGLGGAGVLAAGLGGRSS